MLNMSTSIRNLKTRDLRLCIERCDSLLDNVKSEPKTEFVEIDEEIFLREMFNESNGRLSKIGIDPNFDGEDDQTFEEAEFIDEIVKEEPVFYDSNAAEILSSINNAVGVFDGTDNAIKPPKSIVKIEKEQSHVNRKKRKLSTDTMFTTQIKREQKENIEMDELEQSTLCCSEETIQSTSNLDERSFKKRKANQSSESLEDEQIDTKGLLLNIITDSMLVYRNKCAENASEISENNLTKQDTFQQKEIVNNQGNAKKRRKKSNSKEKQLKCEFCNFSTVQQVNMDNHMRIHTGERPYKCSVCTYSAKQITALNNHMRRHTGEKPFGCNVCSYSATQKTILDNHMRKHTGEKPFKCGFCNYSAKQKANLEVHMRSHNDKKVLKCESWRKTLRNHMRIHAKD